MTDRRMSRERAKAALKELKKGKRLPKNYPLSAYYPLHLLQEKGERLLADTRRRVSEREQIIAGVDAGTDDSFEVSLLEIEDDEAGEAVVAEALDTQTVAAE